MFMRQITPSPLSILILSVVPALGAPARVSFNEDVQPILSEYCYQCHGPDSNTRAPKKAPLRLDREEFAFEMREGLGTPVIVKGDAAASEFIRRLKTKDPDELMPPAKSHKTMKADEIAILEKWITQGAEYEEHWAFIPPTRPALPELPEDLQGWPKNLIDYFTAGRLAAAGMKPNPVEAPRRFLRRLTFDLTGLPPSPEELDAFDAAWDANPDLAAHAAIDRLLASPAYGEHFARHWLDAARYSDTHGIHNDNYRSIWPYRDWVINAYRSNMPFDQFTIEQIGGDLLPAATLDQIVATGFNRCLATTGEGGAIAEEYDAIYAQDRTDTTAAVWLGLTAGCAACHDHKFDPITTKDTYSFNAFFRNTTMAAMDRNKADHPPNIFVPRAGDRSRSEEIDAETARIDQQLKDRDQNAEADFQAWLAKLDPASFRAVGPAPEIHLPLDGTHKNQLAVIHQGTQTLVPRKGKTRTGPLGAAPLLANTNIDLGNIGDLQGSEAFSYGGHIYIEGKPNGPVVARMNETDNYRGWDLWLQDGSIGAHLIQQWPDECTKAVTKSPLKPGAWHHVFVTFNPELKLGESLRIFVDGKPAELKFEKTSLPKDGKISTNVPLRLGSRSKDTRLTGTASLQDFRLYRRLLPEAEIATLARNPLLRQILTTTPDKLSKDQSQKLRNYFLTTVDPVSAELRKQKQTADAERQAIRGRGAVSLVMQEKPGSEPATHILTRGDYTQKAELVTADVPEILPDLPADAPRNRLGLARWLVARDNPLSARVTANRTWYYVFGRGIVETTEDFGIMGSRPSHPQLLDWLAVEFMDSGWNYQHLLKTIVSSATYRQSQSITPGKLEKDPLNVLFSRGPRYRLEAEQIRDIALAASGLLVDEVGGPSVKPYQPGGVWEAVAMKGSNTRHYKPDTGKNLYRRSIYTFHKRTAPHPSMDIFNAPTREVFCVRRERTNTPLQAFVTMNDVQFVEAARQLATTALKATADPAARLDLIYKHLLARPPRDEERPVLTVSLDGFLKAYAASPDEAAKLIEVGDSPTDPDLDPVELAAWTLLTSQILNLDETLTK